MCESVIDSLIWLNTTAKLDRGVPHRPCYSKYLSMTYLKKLRENQNSGNRFRNTRASICRRCGSTSRKPCRTSNSFRKIDGMVSEMGDGNQPGEMRSYGNKQQYCNFVYDHGKDNSSGKQLQEPRSSI
ncbi:hypothetical protein AYI69_g2117 [Smittium culicis]|uniref:Uncharacterized protein n=1 Tax=Smittium culicis TaxID=133412 RepID=A0A1R1YNC4_9FUNG|nr:hypothetical protein AYI69_g2117 [Smittium culicis]